MAFAIHHTRIFVCMRVCMCTCVFLALGSMMSVLSSCTRQHPAFSVLLTSDSVFIAFRYPGMAMVRAPEKVRGADGLQQGLISNLKRIMALEPQIRCEPLKFEWRARQAEAVYSDWGTVSHCSHISFLAGGDGGGADT